MVAGRSRTHVVVELTREVGNTPAGARRLVDRGDRVLATDMVRLRRTIKEQFCHLLGGGCAYTGRSMQDAHDDIGLQPADMGALVEHIQTAMSEEGVPFHTQNRFLAKLAPMRRDVVTR